jgi:ribonuclease HI
MSRSAASLFPDNTAAPPAAADWVSAHCDGGARGNPGPAGYGAVLTDASGKILAELSEFLGNRTNNFAEYSGLLGCLQWILDHGHKNLRVVSDSELMVKQIQGKYKVNSPDLRPLWEEARRRIARLDGFQITHALRHKNKDADRLANEAMDRGTNRAPASTSPQKPTQPTMLRGFTRNGAIQLLGNATLPDGIFVKVIPE